MIKEIPTGRGEYLHDCVMVVKIWVLDDYWILPFPWTFEVTRPTRVSTRNTTRLYSCCKWVTRS
ncbi:hypothetical protein JCGZ_06677 [Jatropha curcas]|uniref:Uncharacterized protein n=1 Tax=Jatropha curcas TaxID=180498 RepID=A0A067LCF9_JATCU|nr:hypothetical protein JCGZ_06677 [Jatropha curcas]